MHPIFSTRIAPPAEPPVDEEYFEWIDMLEAVGRSSGRLLFVELGAGYGRWSARALEAGERRGIASHAILVEAEPSHVHAAHEHMQSRKGSAGTYSVIEAAVGTTRGKQFFVVVGPHGMGPDAWYGQTLAESVAMDENCFKNADDGRDYFGRPVSFSPDGWGAISVPVLALQQILPESGTVDIIDMDIQGAEGDVIEANRALLRSRVACLHIGTHSATVEERIRGALIDDGWMSVWDFPCQSKTPTPFGVVDFVDGVQTWRNPNI